MKIIALAWAPFGHRLDELSEAVGGRRVNITLLYGPRYFAPLRYLALFLRTLILLRSESPDVVLAQNPPVFCPLAALLYCRLSGKRLVIDHHSIWRLKTLGGGPVGKVVGFLEAFVASNAAANTAPHEIWARELRAMGGQKVLVVHDYVQKNPYRGDQALKRSYAGDGTLAIASHGGHPLERVETEVEAAFEIPELYLLVTGPPSKLASRLKHLPPNVKYLGMLPMDDYLKLKASCDFALNVTDEPATLSHVLFEYAASSIPVVSNRSEVVTEAFGDALFYLRSTEKGDVREALQTFLDDPEKMADYKLRIEHRFEELTAARSTELSVLRSVIAREEPRQPR